MKAVEIELYGRVQGVRMRKTIQKYARKIGVKGYVKNMSNGSVYVYACGERNLLEELSMWLQKSPGLSTVERFNLRWKELGEDKQKYGDFEIVKDTSFLNDKKEGFVNLGRYLFNKGKSARHIAIIPDGNRRWAKQRGLESVKGYDIVANYEHIMSLFDEAKKGGAKYLSLWGFSTENWNRDKMEIDYLFDTMGRLVDEFITHSERNRIKFRHIGRKDRLPEKLLSKIDALENATRKHDDFHVLICLDYGGRDEILRAINRMLNENVKEVDEKVFGEYLDSSGIPDPDLIIRTSGEHRLSGFMPFQGVYAELYFASCYFPEFTPEEFRKAIKLFSERVRRFGATARQDLEKNGKK